MTWGLDLLSFNNIVLHPYRVAKLPAAVANAGRSHDCPEKRSVLANELDRVAIDLAGDGFHRIRHYGFLANGRGAKLGLCRRLLASLQQNNLEPSAESAAVAAERLAVTHCCPCCGGAMVMLATWRCGQAPPNPFWNDTS